MGVHIPGDVSVLATVSTPAAPRGRKGPTLGGLAAAGSDAIAVTQANATEHHLVSIGDLEPYSPGWAADPR